MGRGRSNNNIGLHSRNYLRMQVEVRMRTLGVSMQRILTVKSTKLMTTLAIARCDFPHWLRWRVKESERGAIAKSKLRSRIAALLPVLYVGLGTVK